MGGEGVHERGMGVGERGEGEGVHPGESRPPSSEAFTPQRRSHLRGPQRPSRPSQRRSHLGWVTPNGHRTIIRAGDLVIPHTDARARAVADLADLGAT